MADKWRKKGLRKAELGQIGEKDKNKGQGAKGWIRIGLEGRGRGPKI